MHASQQLVLVDGRVAVHPSQCLMAVRCTNDLVTLCAQHSGEQFAVSFVVVGYEDYSLMAFRSRHITSSTILSSALEGLRTSTLVERQKRIHPAPGNENAL